MRVLVSLVNRSTTLAAAAVVSPGLLGRASEADVFTQRHHYCKEQLERMRDLREAREGQRERGQRGQCVYLGMYR